MLEIVALPLTVFFFSLEVSIYFGLSISHTCHDRWVWVLQYDFSTRMYFDCPGGYNITIKLMLISSIL